MEHLLLTNVLALLYISFLIFIQHLLFFDNAFNENTSKNFELINMKLHGLKIAVEGFKMILIICRYERFLKIMILSVLKNTNRPVKFWFIKNYLSPQFKARISICINRSNHSSSVCAASFYACYMIKNKVFSVTNIR